MKPINYVACIMLSVLCYCPSYSMSKEERKAFGRQLNAKLQKKSPPSTTTSAETTSKPLKHYKRPRVSRRRPTIIPPAPRSETPPPPAVEEPTTPPPPPTDTERSQTPPPPPALNEEEKIRSIPLFSEFTEDILIPDAPEGLHLSNELKEERMMHILSYPEDLDNLLVQEQELARLKGTDENTLWEFYTIDQKKRIKILQDLRDIPPAPTAENA